jgi:hypothetical protein
VRRAPPREVVHALAGTALVGTVAWFTAAADLLPYHWELDDWWRGIQALLAAGGIAALWAAFLMAERARTRDAWRALAATVAIAVCWALLVLPAAVSG